jgi:hypothetical protein
MCPSYIRQHQTAIIARHYRTNKNGSIPIVSKKLESVPSFKSEDEEIERSAPHRGLEQGTRRTSQWTESVNLPIMVLM